MIIRALAVAAVGASALVATLIPLAHADTSSSRTVFAPKGSAEPAASRILDRTFSCEAGYVGGLHQVNVQSYYTTPEGSAKLRVFSSITQNMFTSLGSMSSEGVRVHRGLCSVSRKALHLTTKSLRGGVASQVGVEATCETPRRVLLRVRAIFRRPVATRIVRTFGFPQLTVTGELDQASMAIGSPSGEPIAYVSVTGTEKSRLFTRPSCKED